MKTREEICQPQLKFVCHLDIRGHARSTEATMHAYLGLDNAQAPDPLRELRALARYRVPYSLRHLAGTRLCRATEDLYVVTTLPDHANASTSRIYAEMDRARSGRRRRGIRDRGAG